MSVRYAALIIRFFTPAQRLAIHVGAIDLNDVWPPYSLNAMAKLAAKRDTDWLTACLGLGRYYA